MVKSAESRANKQCASHPKQPIIFYCYDCKTRNCSVCIENHKTHNFKHMQTQIKSLVGPWSKLLH